MQVFIKLKSTTNATGPDESSSDFGLTYDGFGYGVSFPHFAGLLKNPEFKRYIAEVRDAEDSPVDPPEKRGRFETNIPVGTHFLSEGDNISDDADNE